MRGEWNMSKIITFPHMGNYSYPVSYLLKHITNAEVRIAPKITDRTIELGTKYSPDFVCTPFKYTLGTFIEGLENGANILIQAGGGCRYGYYGELQEKILRDLEYQFDYYNLVSEGQTSLKRIYRMMREIEPKFSFIKGIYYLTITKKMIRYMDEFDNYIRERIGFELEEGNYLTILQDFLESFSNIKNLFQLKKIYKKYYKKLKQVRIKKPKDCLKVGIVGELYTLMEPFANYDLEMTLAKYHIEVKRFTNAHYLMFEKRKEVPKYLEKAKKYIAYRMGADAADNIGRTKYLCENGYDGIIHIKSSFCTPEIGAMPIIQKIADDYNVPILFFSFDSGTSKVGIETRLEAFYDMLEMRKDK